VPKSPNFLDNNIRRGQVGGYAPVLLTTVVVGIIAGGIFSIFPQIDLWFGGLFYLGDHVFAWRYTPAGKVPRAIFQFLFVAFACLTIAGLVGSLVFRHRLLGFGFQKWLYLTACMLIGPGLIVNVVFKDHWGRARPFEIKDFGASQPFTPALQPANNCADNCSFVSGEAATIFMMFFALAMLLRARRSILLAGGVVAGGLSGLVRIGMGGHFLSDVVFSGVFMALTALVLHWLMFVIYGDLLKDNGPLHKKLQR
jgi:lipid A 4'-phosphatase